MKPLNEDSSTLANALELAPSINIAPHKISSCVSSPLLRFNALSFNSFVTLARSIRVVSSSFAVPIKRRSRIGFDPMYSVAFFFE